MKGFSEIDRRIIGELVENGRLSFAELGRRVNLSPPAVAERVQRLERGVIAGYHAEIDPKALGYPLTAIIRVKPAPASWCGSPSSRRDRRSASATASPARTAST
jgi:Lrp/AsnC family leucine-responsive transcriptional regulator